MKKYRKQRQFYIKICCLFLFALFLLEAVCFAYPREYYYSVYRKPKYDRGMNFEIDFDELENELNIFINRDFYAQNLKPADFTQPVISNIIVSPVDSIIITKQYFDKKSSFDESLREGNKRHFKFKSVIGKVNFNQQNQKLPQKLIFEDSDRDGISDLYDKKPNNPNKS